MSKFKIEVSEPNFVALRVQGDNEEDFFNVVREVIAGRINGVDCVYLVSKTYECTWYEGNYYDVWYKETDDCWENTFGIFPKWVLGEV
jgi:hypothetical protein